MSKRRDFLAQTQEESKKDNVLIASKEENNNNLTIDEEIECPRCYDIMTLYSNFDGNHSEIP